MNENNSEIKSNTQWSKESSKPKKWQWALHSIFLPLSIVIMYLGCIILKISNVLMFDTHHMEINIKGK